MANSKISALTSATTPLAGTETLPIVQSGATTKVTVANLTAGRAVSMSSATVGPNALALSGAVVDIGNDRNSPTRVGISNQNTGASAVAGINLEAAGGGWQMDVPADVVTFANPLIGKFGGTEKFRFTSDGNYVPKTAAKGINFTANTPAAGMTSQLLNWYEEGAYTPTVTASTGSITSYTASANYTRIGRQVTVVANVSITNAGTATGALKISLPFTANSGYTFTAYGRENNATGNMLQGYIVPSGTVVNVLDYKNATTILSTVVAVMTIIYTV